LVVGMLETFMVAAIDLEAGRWQPAVG